MKSIRDIIKFKENKIVHRNCLFIYQAIEIVLLNYRKLQMKKIKIIPKSSPMSSPHKFTQNLLKKQPNKQFQLLYRERDQSVQENPIESIIFVKSKSCKPTSQNKKTKVHQEFKKIMNDLDTHITQHKKNKSLEKKSFSPNSSQTKVTTLSKKLTKQSDFLSNLNKTVQNEAIKTLKTANKGNQVNVKHKSQNVQQCRSPKKDEINHLSPNSKRFLSQKSPKIQKENIETKRFNHQKVNRTKSPHKKNRKDSANETECDETLKKAKFIQISSQTNQNFNNPSEELKKTSIKRNIRRIPLEVEEYIFLEDNFELVKQKCLYKLQTKLLSTYRNNAKQFEYGLQLKQNSQSIQKIFQKINPPESKQDYFEFIERQEPISVQSRSQFNLESEIKDFSITDQLLLNQIIQKTIIIQKWWRKILKLECIGNYIDKFLKNQKINKHPQNIQTQINYTTPANLPSSKSLIFNEKSEQESECKQNEQISMLKNQNQIVNQKKILHQQILKNLLIGQKISQDQFDVKMTLVQREYQNQLKEIMGLYRLFQGESQQNQFLIQSGDKISQGKNISNNDYSVKKQIEHNKQDSEEQNDENNEEDLVQMKQYKIGNKITSDMQSFIENAKKNKFTVNQEQQNNFDSEKYNIRKSELGQEYFQDFQSGSSNEASPHKILQLSSFNKFEAEIDAEIHGAFQPNTNFIQMLQNYKEQQEIRSLIQQRIAMQMGAFKPSIVKECSIDTSILGIHQFLVSFFKFYLYYYKDEFLRFINMPYGYQPQKRLKFIQGYEDTSEDLSEDQDGIIYGLEYVISDDIFEEFIEQYYGNSLQTATEKQKALIQCSQVHDRAVFECFNEALNNFRPYYSIGGPPYIWNCSQKTLTFYFIAEENIQEVFQKTEYRVMKWASALLGLQVQANGTKKEESTKEIEKNNEVGEQKLFQTQQYSQQKCHPLIAQTRESRVTKEERLQLLDSMSKWNEHQQQRTSTVYQLSSLILEQLAEQLTRQFLINV